MILPIRIVLAEDNAMFAQCFRHLAQNNTDIYLCGVATTANELQPLIKETSPDIIVAGFEMADEQLAQLCCTIYNSHPQIAVIVWASSSDQHEVAALLQAGIKGFLLKKSNENELLQAIRKVYKGETSYSCAISHILLMHHTGKLPSQLLNEKHMGLLKMICNNKTSVQIAKELYLSEAAVESRRKQLMRILNVTTVVELVVYAFKNELHKRWVIFAAAMSSDFIFSAFDLAADVA